MSFLRVVGALAAAAAILAGCAAAGAPAPDITLTADNGQPWRLSGQTGRPVLLTFGFTHCADTCPATLAKLSRMKRDLGAAGRRLEIVMVSVDPQRDTPATLHAFVSKFGGPVVGLTGTPAQIRAVEAAYHVWSAPLHKGRDGNYDVAHTAVITIVDAGGRLRGVVNDDDSVAALKRALHGVAG